jgi:hypothetical protein
MKLGLSIAKRWRAAARMLALVAGLALAFGVHPPHVEAASAGSHHATGDQSIAVYSHFGAACLQAEVDKSRPATNGAVPLNHADCTQMFDPLQRPALAAAPTCVVVAVAALHDLPFRQLITAFDPPPPRRG